MKSLHILHIDDDEDDQEFLIMALKEATDSAICNSYYNAKEALQKLIDKNITADMIFLDLNIPIMSGQEFLVEIKKDKHLRSIPVIILSTSSIPATKQLMKALGAQDFITKPNSLDELINLLKPHLAKNL